MKQRTFEYIMGDDYDENYKEERQKEEEELKIKEEQEEELKQ